MKWFNLLNEFDRTPPTLSSLERLSGSFIQVKQIAIQVLSNSTGTFWDDCEQDKSGYALSKLSYNRGCISVLRLL